MKLKLYKGKGKEEVKVNKQIRSNRYNGIHDAEMSSERETFLSVERLMKENSTKMVFEFKGAYRPYSDEV